MQKEHFIKFTCIHDNSQGPRNKREIPQFDKRHLQVTFAKKKKWIHNSYRNQNKFHTNQRLNKKRRMRTKEIFHDAKSSIAKRQD